MTKSLILRNKNGISSISSFAPVCLQFYAESLGQPATLRWNYLWCKLSTCYQKRAELSLVEPLPCLKNATSMKKQPFHSSQLRSVFNAAETRTTRLQAKLCSPMWRKRWSALPLCLAGKVASFSKVLHWPICIPGGLQCNMNVILLLFTLILMYKDWAASTGITFQSRTILW